MSSSMQKAAEMIGWDPCKYNNSQDAVTWHNEQQREFVQTGHIRFKDLACILNTSGFSYNNPSLIVAEFRLISIIFLCYILILTITADMSIWLLLNRHQIYLRCPWTDHWPGSLNCECLLNADNIGGLLWRAFLRYTGSNHSAEGQSNQSYVFTPLARHIHVCFYLRYNHVGENVVCFFQGQVISRLIKAATIFVSAAYKWQNNPFNVRKQNVRGREWLVKIITV